jgi:hypothetical protein
MTTQSSDENNESVAQDDKFRQFAADMGSHVQRMGNAKELASLVLTVATNDYLWGTITILDGGFALRLPGNM